MQICACNLGFLSRELQCDFRNNSIRHKLLCQRKEKLRFCEFQIRMKFVSTMMSTNTIILLFPMDVKFKKVTFVFYSLLISSADSHPIVAGKLLWRR